MSSDSKKPNKLKILCIHGYINNAEIMKYQMANIISTFSSICDFTFANAPHQCTTDEPIPFFLERGMKPEEFRAWSSNINEHIRIPASPTSKSHYLKTTVNYFGIKESILYLVEMLNEDRYDGICAFSQGSYISCGLLHCLMRFGK